MSFANAEGRFVRPPSKFRDRVERLEPGRYHLYVSWACPWAHRTIILRKLLGLEDAISMSVVDPYRDDRGWKFSGGAYTDPVNGFGLLGEAYDATDTAYEGRISVPVLWDKQEGRIVNNESADIVRMMGEWAPDGGPVLYPTTSRKRIDELNDRIYETVNNGVYKAGFATSQAAHEEAVLALFETLKMVEGVLGDTRWLAGTDEPSEADWRLFTTLVRFDTVYALHFKCNVRRIEDHPNLWAYTRELYQWPGVAQTVRMDEIKRHYYTTHPSINPTRIIPVGPALDFDAPHGREALR